MLYCSSECGSISIMHAQLRTIYCNTYVYTIHVCLCLLALTFVCNSTYLLKCSFQIYSKSIVVFIRSRSKIWFKTTSCAIKGPVTRCNFPGNLQRNSTLKRCKLVTNVWYVKNILANCDGNVYLPILHLQEKLHPRDRALIHVCLAYLFLHSGQVLRSFKCYFKRKYLNLIDSNCDVDASCPWFFIYRDCPSLPQPALNILSIYMWYWAGAISLRWVQFDLLASRRSVAFGLVARKGCTSPSFSVQICRACLAIGIEYQLLLTYTEVIN